VALASKPNFVQGFDLAATGKHKRSSSRRAAGSHLIIGFSIPKDCWRDFLRGTDFARLPEELTFSP
jgi:hypothetical protein